MILTDTAAAHVLKLFEDNDDAVAVRIVIQGGGCSGYTYTFAFAEEIDEGDIVVNDSGAVVVVDPVSYALISESTLDFQDTMQGSAFSLSVPNSQSCGCGQSFTL